MGPSHLASGPHTLSRVCLNVTALALFSATSHSEVPRWPHVLGRCPAHHVAGWELGYLMLHAHASSAGSLQSWDSHPGQGKRQS